MTGGVRRSKTKAAARPERPTARSRRREQVREAILESAADLLSRAPEASIRDIAAEAGYSASALYTYFQTKNEIVAALQARVLNAMEDTFRQPVPEGLTFAQRLELLLWRQLDVADRNRALFQVMLATRTAEHVARAHDAIEGLVERSAAWFEKAPIPSELQHHPPRRLAWILFGIAGAFHKELLTEPGKHELAKDARQIVSLFLRGVEGTTDKVTATSAKRT